MRNVQKILMFYFLFSSLLINNLFGQCQGKAYDDPATNNSYYIEAMNIDCAWEITEGDPNISVAIVDLYFDITHPDLEDKFVYVENNCNPATVVCNHGTSMAGAVAGIVDNGICVAGAGNKTTVAGYCVASTCRSGNPRPKVLQAYNDGYEIISLSWSTIDLSISEAREMVDNGVVIVTSGRGNNHSGYHDIDGVIVVGQADQNYNHVPYGSSSEYQQNGDKNIDIYATTINVPRLTPFGNCAVGTGNSSFGAATVAGIVALMKDVNPCLTPGDIERIIKSTHQGLPRNASQLINVRNGIIDAYEAVKAARDFTGQDIEVVGQETWSDRMISGDLTVETGAELTITGTVQLSSNSDIRIKRGARIILDGGTLMLNPSCKDENNKYWGKLVVEGNSVNLNDPQDAGKIFFPQPVNELSVLNPNQAGVFVARNGAVISDSRNITTYAYNYPWPEENDYWGGLIVCENTTFKNCRRAVAFMKYGNMLNPDNSRFSNCLFEDCEVGITNWASSGVRVENCTFKNIKNISYGTYDAATSVKDGNKFIGNPSHNNNRAFDIINTHPTVGETEIGGFGAPNTIEDYAYGFYLTAQQSNLGIKLVDNLVKDCYFGVLATGVSTYNMFDNEFTSNEYGILLRSTGQSQLNYIQDNVFQDNMFYSGYVLDNNGSLKIINNCFNKGINNNYSDILLGGASGSLFNKQETDRDFSAGNIFSMRPDQDVIPFDIFRGNTSFAPFNYHMSMNCSGIGCLRDPRKVDGGTSIRNNVAAMSIKNDKSDDKNVDCMGIDDPEVVEELQYYLDMNKGELKNHLRSRIQSVPDYYLKDELTYEANEIMLIRKALTYQLVLDNDISDLNMIVNEFSPNTIDEAMLYYAAYMEFSPKLAKPYLRSLNFENEQWNDIRRIQEINLARLIDNHEATASELNYLYSKAIEPSPYMGYARGLYHYFTGKHPEIELGVQESQIEPRSEESKSDKSIVQLSPNPFTSNILVTSELRNGHITIYNTSGQLVATKQIRSNNESIDLVELAEGVYIIEIYDQDNHKIYQDKIVKQ